jgi:methylphosphotriester-DNA--protein-cysteine methyltransferase
MLYRLYSPPPPLGHFVGLLWLYEGFRPAHPRERLLPTGTVEIVINLREDRSVTYGRKDIERPLVRSGEIVCGAHSEYFVIDTNSQDGVIGVHFRPGGAFPFLKLPAGELHNQHVDLSQFWGRQAASELRERLLAARSPEAKLRVLERALLEAACGEFDRHTAVAYALDVFHQAPAGRSIREVTERTGLSARRFIDLFEKEVGLTPKLFCRVQRFQRVLKSIALGGRVDWVDLALTCGYYDQAHFIHDFRAFSGINPSTYLAAHTPHLNHVPLYD